MEKWCYKRVEKGASVPTFITNAKSNKNFQLHIAFEPLFSLANFRCYPKINDKYMYFPVEWESISKKWFKWLFYPLKQRNMNNVPCFIYRTKYQSATANYQWRALMNWNEIHLQIDLNKYAKKLKWKLFQLSLNEG